MDKNYVIGIDYGTDSVRAVIFDCANGEAVTDGVALYPRWSKGEYCELAINQFRQHPLDYVESLELAVKTALTKAPAGLVQKIKGLCVDTTGSTPVAVNQQGTPLALTSGFEHNPNAMFILWKDHTAAREADEINQLARNWGGVDFTRYVGGIYSPEWFWAKLLHVTRKDVRVREAAFSWVEHCDWITAELTGDTNPLTLKRSRCAAGHKAMWHKDFGGLPSDDFLQQLDPLLEGLRDRLYDETFTSDNQAGTLSESWAETLGLEAGISVGVGTMDAHMGAVGAGIRPYTLVKVIGTSSCDMLVAPNEEIGDKLIRGICGQVDGSIIPGMLGLEAGQSAFGDLYAWFRDLLTWPLENILQHDEQLTQDTKQELLANIAGKIIPELSRAAEKIAPESSAIVALDWHNGRRTPDANPAVKGAMTGLTLGSDAPRIFRSLVEATAFGAKSIVERFNAEGIRIDEVIALGGVARKSPLVMQILADVLNCKIKVSSVDQACALGTAMYASVAAGLHPNLAIAQQAMDGGFEQEYHPDKQQVERYLRLYQSYNALGQVAEASSAAS
jgi:L-ribulokinase